MTKPDPTPSIITSVNPSAPDTSGGKNPTVAKKRKRAPSTKKKKQVVSPAPVKTCTPPPTSLLIIDNGGHTLKYGWATDSTPLAMPNITGRLRHQITVLSGDEIERVQPNQLEVTTRSFERGFINNMGNQLQVWKRLLDKLRIGGINTNSEVSQAFGWNVSRKGEVAPKLLSTRDCAVLLLLPPQCPRVLLDQICQVWFEDFNVSHLGFALSSVATVATSKEMQKSSRCCCVVDAGWSATNIAPTYKGKAIGEGIRRIHLGGRHLINILKYHVSYRQWNLMDQEWILQDILERLTYFSSDFGADMKLARKIPMGKRSWDRDYVLPDMQTIFKGTIRLTPQLQRQLEEVAEQKPNVQNKDTTTNEEQDEDEDDEDFKEGDSESEHDGNDSEGEETDAQIRRRVMQQREEEERRRRVLETEHQVLNISVERFATPEVYFRPSDAGMPRDMPSLSQAIVQSINACPAKFRAALYGNVLITGGMAQIENFQTRLECELRSLAPSQYKVCVNVSQSPINQAWLGARDSIRDIPSGQWSISRDEWEYSKKDPKKRKAWHSLLAINGGVLV